MSDMNKVLYQVLNNKQCSEIVDAMYRILERTGCEVKNSEARDILQAAGCQVTGELVKIPAEVARKAVSKAPSEITLYSRSGKPAMELKPGNVYFGPAITIPQISDLETGKKRSCVLQDCENAVTIMDALNHISWVSALISPTDVNEKAADLEELYAVLKNTDKPLMYWAQNVKNLEYEYRMFEAAAGSREQVKEKPFMINLVCPMDPLCHTDDGMAQVISLSRHSSPIVYIAGVGFGLTAPVTLAGGIALGMADTIVGLIVSQLVNPGTPFVVSKFNDNVNMRNMNVTHSSPEMLIAQAATADVFRFMNLPFCSNFGGTDNAGFDEGSVFDKGVQIYTALLSRTNMNFALGAYQSGAYAKLEDLVYCNELIEFLQVLACSPEVSEETLAEDVIDEVGPGGVFFAEDHTLDHIHDLWESSLMTPSTPDQKPGKREADVRQRAKDILTAGPRHPLPSETLKQLRDIIQEAAEAL